MENIGKSLFFCTHLLQHVPLTQSSAQKEHLISKAELAVKSLLNQLSCYFCSTSSKILAMITSLVEMLELPNFEHIITYIKVWRYNLAFILGRPRVVNFAHQNYKHVY